MPVNLIVLIGIAALIALMYFFVFIAFFGTWIRLKTNGVPITFFDLIFMRLRKVDMKLMVDCLIKTARAGLKISRAQLENHYLTGGHVDKVVAAMIRAQMRGVDVTFRTVAAVDLGGYDLDSIDPDTFESVISGEGDCG